MSNEKLYLAAISCPHVIDSNTVTLHFDPKQPGHNALNQLSLRLEAALAQQPQADEVTDAQRWQPIETAPKDATRVLVWRSHSTVPLIVRYDAGYGEFENEFGEHIYHLTHWMPLPQPPAMQKETK